MTPVKWAGILVVVLFGLAVYVTRRQVGECEARKCKPPLCARMVRSTHYTNECLCVELPQ